jgi:hypothetical protein
MSQPMKLSLDQWKDIDHTRNIPRKNKSENGQNKNNMVINTFSSFTPALGVKAVDSSTTILKSAMTFGTSEQRIRNLAPHGEKPTKKRMSK